MDNLTIVQVRQGILRGINSMTIYDTPYIAFQAIPYAAPPIGNLRFMDPQPPHSWIGIRECLPQKGNFCVQRVIWPHSQIIGSEDCLYLNIYVPRRLRNTTRIAVMVWIHGGQYMTGNGNFHNAQPDYLMEKNIILVTVNYRLGAFGFLNLNHKLASGNQGLKDQVAALMWINKNIAAFGGNPNNITLFGSNAGAICVHLLMISPLSKDLFHKAILQSGVAMMNWSIEENCIISRSFKLAAAIDKSSSDIENVIRSLKAASAADIIKAQYQPNVLTPPVMDIVTNIFGPSIDRFSENPFFTRSLSDLYYNCNQKPVIIGQTSLEFMRFLNECTVPKLQRLYNEIPLHMGTLLPVDAPQVEREKMGKRFQELYFNNIPPTLFKLRVLLRCFSDILFDHPIQMMADIRRHVAEAPTYVYEFSYVGNHKVVDNNAYWYTVNLPESTQYDDVAYLFYLPEYLHRDSVYPLLDDDFKMVQVMTSMWTNFARTGDPSPNIGVRKCITWEPATRENFYCLDINKELRIFTLTYFDRAIRRLM